MTLLLCSKWIRKVKNISGGDTINEKKKYKYIRETEVYDGKQYEGWGKTKAEARRKLADKIDAAKRGDIGISENMTVKAWASTWLETYNKSRVRKPGAPKLRGTMNEATYKEYEQLCRNYIVPEVGKLRMREVKTAHLQKILNDNKERSFSHVAKLNITIRKMFHQATVDRIIPYNPADGMTLPAAKKGKRRSLSAEEKSFFFKAADKNRHGLLFRFLAATGIRPNELAAIRVGDIDIEQKVVHITKAVETGHKTISDPKTASGVRYTVINTHDDPTIIQSIADLIAEREVTDFLFTKADGKSMLTRQAFKSYWASFSRTWDLEMGAEHDSRGHIYDPSDLKADGTPLYPDPNDPTKPRNGHKLSPEVVTYCLRHTFGTDMQRNNVPIEVTQYLMGHADISTTANIYVDTGKEDALRAVGILDKKNHMGNSMGKKD